jgi:hypothetical protein
MHLQDIKHRYSMLRTDMRMWTSYINLKKHLKSDNVSWLVSGPVPCMTEEDVKEEMRTFVTRYLKTVESFVQSHGADVLMPDIRTNVRRAKAFLKIAEEDGVQIPALRYSEISRWANWYEPLQGDEAGHSLTETELRRIERALLDMGCGKSQYSKEKVESLDYTATKKVFAASNEYRVNILVCDEPEVMDH